MPKGRPRKPTADLKRNGTYQEHKHGGRRLEPSFDGKPIRPRGLPKDARALWDKVVPMLVQKGVAVAADAPALELMCIWWGRLKQLQRKKESNYQIDCRLAMASKQWQALACKFGLTPADRARLEVEAGNDETNPFEQLLKDQPTAEDLKVVG